MEIPGPDLIPPHLLIITRKQYTATERLCGDKPHSPSFHLYLDKV